MNAADFNELSEAEKRYFYQCKRCGEMVDMRQLDDVVFHETDHKPRPESDAPDVFKRALLNDGIVFYPFIRLGA